jgi:hypothetical protein
MLPGKLLPEADWRNLATRFQSLITTADDVYQAVSALPDQTQSASGQK